MGGDGLGVLDCAAVVKIGGEQIFTTIPGSIWGLTGTYNSLPGETNTTGIAAFSAATPPASIMPTLEDRFELPAGGLVGLVELLASAPDGGTPPARCAVEPRPPRRLASHNGSTMEFEDRHRKPVSADPRDGIQCPIQCPAGRSLIVSPCVTFPKSLVCKVLLSRGDWI